MAKRGYKLQEFVAHSSAVNCLSIGKKTSRLLVTGGEDYKVNLWAIGKPTSLLSLSGHTSSVESLTFDSSEVLVVSGASTGVIKLWDLEEGKIVRTLTGHKSQCNTLEFHPFGEFFASGSSDTNLKIWDVRKKGCIHTYKGHTRGVSTIRFTPDGRWVVSGGADSVVKVWDLTAGKLLHEFKFHDRPIRCLDFHPLEFLLATGSADKTVNFWDLETFELIGSAGPEATGVRSMTFHPDGKTLFCGLEDSLKVYSWEPIICHDSVDMGWPTLGGLSIHEGKLLACSYYRNCVGVWVADISLIGPYDAGSSLLSHVNMERTLDIQESHSAERLRGLINSNSRLLTTAEDIESLEIRNIYVDTSASKKVTPKRLGSISATKVVLPLDSSEAINPSASKKIPEPTTHTRSSSQVVSRPAVTQVVSRPAVTVPVVVPRNNPNAGNPANSRRESMTPEGASPGMLLKSTHKRRAPNSKSETDLVRAESRCLNSNTSDFDSLPEPKFRFSFFPAKDEASETSDDNNKNMTVTRNPENNLSPDVPLSSSNENCDESQSYSREISSSRPVNGGVQFGRTRSLVERFERREICNSKSEDLSISASIDEKRESHTLLHVSKGQPQKFGLESVKFDNEPKGRPQSSGGVKFDNEPKGRPQSSGGVQFDNEPKGRPQSSGGESVKLDDVWKRQAQTSGCRSVKFDNEQKGRPQTSGGESVRCDNERKRQPQISGGYSVRFDNERKRQPQTSRGDSVKFDDEQTRRPHTYGEESVKFNIELEDQPHTSGGEPTSQSDEDVMSYLMQNHDTFSSSLRSRLTKLQVVRHFWQRNDIKGGINVVGKLPDHYVQSDVVSVLMEKMDILTLDLFSCLLPMVMGLLNSRIDRHMNVSLEMLLKLVAIFGPVIQSTMSASPSVGVDLQAERRRDCCKQCFIQLQKIKQVLPSVVRRGGLLARSAQELNLVLRDL